MADARPPDSMSIAPPSVTGPAGPQFEGKVGAFYFLALLASAEPRGLSGAQAKSVRFQQGAHGRPLDDVTITAANADGSDAILDIQAKRTLDFTKSDAEFGDAVKRLWLTSQKQEFSSARYETAVAIERTSTRIERDCQAVLQWARRLADGAAFTTHMGLEGFSSAGMRDFMAVFRHHLAAAGAPTDDDTVWRLLRRFQILVFDFESPGSDYDHRARELARTTLSPEQGNRAADLWSVLATEALAYDAVGGTADRVTLARTLAEKHGLTIGERPDLQTAFARLRESTADALASIRDNISGVHLSRADIVEQAYQALDQAPVVQIIAKGGVGKSSILKSLVERVQCEGTALLLVPGRVIGGGWLKMAPVIGCPGTVSRLELLNELGCCGGATLFIDNIDQIDDADAWPTIGDLLRSVMESRGWRIVLTLRSETPEWLARLPDNFRQLRRQSIQVGEISDAEADLLRAANSTLSALLSDQHPARAIARNLFHLSRMLALFSAGDQAGTDMASELDLAAAWWRFGGGRSEDGKWERLKLLRALGEQLIRQPSLAAFQADTLESRVVAELLSYESLREIRQGATVAFWHDTLRDWTVGLSIDENPGVMAFLPTAQPLPGALSRGLEIAARLALLRDQTGERWQNLLVALERADCHGSWRRPILLALTRSDNVVESLNRTETLLAADRGRRLCDLLRLMIAVEAEPVEEVFARHQLAMPSVVPSGIAYPAGEGWMPLVLWTLAAADRLPSAVIPELSHLYRIWLMATHAHPQITFNRMIAAKLHDWLARIEDAMRPITRPVKREDADFDLDFDNLRRVHEDIRLTFLAFCHLSPEATEKYLRSTDPGSYEARDILKLCGPAAKAAPAALADFALAVLIPKDDEDDLCGVSRHRFDPFDLIDTSFVPSSPGQGPFFELLQSSAGEGLRLVRGLVGYATDWHKNRFSANGTAFPVITIPFPDGTKSFEGTFTIYQWARGGTGALIAASALMALEAWAHRQIEVGRPFGDVLHDVLGPCGSSVAFVCVAADLVLSHWQAAQESAWPMLAVPELLHFDKMRFDQDQSGLGRFQMEDQESSHWPVKIADLTARVSRRRALTEAIGHLTFNGPVQILRQVREALDAARKRIAENPPPNDSDPINGLHATAANALRMTDKANWISIKGHLPDGREVEGYQYQLPPEEAAAVAAAQLDATSNLTDLSVRLSLQKVIEQPSSSTAELVAQGIAWARSQIASGKDEEAEDGDRDDFDATWCRRAIAMAAALAARDYSGADRAATEAWAHPILVRAIVEAPKHIAESTSHICSSIPAIGTVGIASLYLKNAESGLRNTLLGLAARQDHAVLNALALYLNDFEHLDARLPRSLTRIVMNSVVQPRRQFDDPAADAANLETHRQRVGGALQTEIDWLDGRTDEPAWPELVAWHSRPRRYLRIGRRDRDDERGEPRLMPEAYVDEQTFSLWVAHLVRFAAGDAAEWTVGLAQHLMTWTIEANNGPPGEDNAERENRPSHWNIRYFDFLGILCVALPFDRARSLFLDPMTQLHNEAFHDALSSFLRAFDRATLAPDTKQPENPRAVRTLLADRLRQERMGERLNYEVSFRAESHLADALNAMFYQPSRWENAGYPYIPKQWPGLLETMPVLTPLVTAAPNSGYLAAVFMTLVESYPYAALIPDIMQVVTAWCAVHGAGAGFWTIECQLGLRLCAWLDAALTADSGTLTALGQFGAELGRCLDVFVRSGLTAARLLETRILEAQASTTAV